MRKVLTKLITLYVRYMHLCCNIFFRIDLERLLYRVGQKYLDKTSNVSYINIKIYY